MNYANTFTALVIFSVLSMCYAKDGSDKPNINYRTNGHKYNPLGVSSVNACLFPDTATHPENVRAFLRVTKYKQLPQSRYLQIRIANIIREMIAVERSRQTREPLRVELCGHYAGYLVWLDDNRCFIKKRKFPPVFFTWPQIRNIILNNQFGLA